ncbi:MAG: ribonuclease P protein component [Alloprevotella sp.]|nr:ribonuclease P protein component [Alloprevotella sp.]
MRAQTFSKAERLCRRRDIDALFASGTCSVSVYPVRAVFRAIPYNNNSPQVRILVSVAKRHLRLAVNRNRAKRQIREAYRRNKAHLTGNLPAETALHIAFIWLSDKPESSLRVGKSVVRLLQLITERACSPLNAPPCPCSPTS